MLSRRVNKSININKRDKYTKQIPKTQELPSNFNPNNSTLKTSPRQYQHHTNNIESSLGSTATFDQATNPPGLGAPHTNLKNINLIEG